MSHLNIVRLLWAVLAVLIFIYIINEVIGYFGTEHIYDQRYWQMKRIVVFSIVNIFVLYSAIYVGRKGVYVKVSIIIISLFFGIYGVFWLLLGGEGHILWRIGFPGFLILLCVYTLIVQKKYWSGPPK